MTSGPDWEHETKLEQYRRKLKTSLGARFVMRFHVSMMLGASILVGWLADLILLKIGYTSMLFRYPVAIGFAYLGFLVAVWLWIEYSGINEYLKLRNAEPLIGAHVRETRSTEKSSSRSTDWLDLPFNFPAGDGEGCLIVLGLLLVFGVLFFFLGGYLWMYATEFAVEIVLELLLAAGLLRGIRRIESSGWIAGVWRSTKWSLAFSVIVAFLFAAWAHSSYPTATTLPEVIARWRG